MGFAAAGLSQEDDRAVFVDEAQRGEVLDEFGVDAGLEVEVEVFDAAPDGEAGVAQARRQSPVAVGGGLFGDELCEELDVVQSSALACSARVAKHPAAASSLRYPRSAFICS